MNAAIDFGTSAPNVYTSSSNFFRTAKNILFNRWNRKKEDGVAHGGHFWRDLPASKLILSVIAEMRDTHCQGKKITDFTSLFCYSNNLIGLGVDLPFYDSHLIDSDTRRALLARAFERAADYCESKGL